jgi:hypothetical protein
MYRPYPGGTQIPEVRRPTAPPSLQKAARFMYTGSGLSIIGIAVNITAAHTTARSLLTHEHKSLTATQINQAVAGLRALDVIVGLIAAVVWLWLARSCLAGRHWARITGTVFFGLATIENLDLFAFKMSVLVHLYGLLVWLIGLGAVIFLWRRESTAYLKPPPPSAFATPAP